MDLRRTAPLNQRRRRVLQEELAPPDGEEVPVSRKSRTGSKAARTYSESALAENQPKITDLIPHRRWVQVATLALLIMAIAGLGVIQASLPAWETRLGDETAALLNPSAPGSLSRWLSSAMLAWAGVLSLVVFSLRRHKADDFHARYRIWLGSGILLFIASMTVSTGAHHLGIDSAKLLAEYLLPESSIAAYSRSICWAGIIVIGLVFLVRLAFEMRGCGLSLATSISAATGYLCAALVPWIWSEPTRSQQIGLIAVTVRLVADLLTLLTTMVYGRHVFFEAQGLSMQRSKSKKKSKEVRQENGVVASSDEANDAASTPVVSKRSDLESQPVNSPGSARMAVTSSNATASRSSNAGQSPASTPPSNGERKAPVLTVKRSGDVATEPARDADEDDSDDAEQGLTRSERRRLKKLGKRDRNAA